MTATTYRKNIVVASLESTQMLVPFSQLAGLLYLVLTNREFKNKIVLQGNNTYMLKITAIKISHLLEFDLYNPLGLRNIALKCQKVSEMYL